MAGIASPTAEPQSPKRDGTETLLRFEDVSIAFDNPVLDQISFSLVKGETKVLLGEAGTGKTIILKLALGLIKPDSGRITALGQEISSMPEKDLYAVRRQIGMVFQESALFDSLSVEENVAYRLIEETGDITDEIHARVLEALEFVELGHTYNLFPSELSGGMRRRVAIARAIITQPEALLYDSPTGGLDPVTSNTIIELVVKQRDVYQTGSLLVTHRLQDAFTMASHYFDRKLNKMVPLEDGSMRSVHTTFLILRDHKIIFEGTAPELLRCHDPYIREYLS
ncbi:MAG TPA: ATP-binding cassette domain-containing protein [Candidatus Angelobacter sp.]|jgi:phospholipid/cholesterol/gamma-HCH transport system ATP-binding protein|nr:ATP-binding cassette domain-containing protein [Candidatus Angelobacter sp.]